MEKKVVYDGNTSFLKLGNKIFNVELISEDGMEIENKIVNYHKGVLADTVKVIYDGEHKDSMNEWNTQIQKLNDLSRVNGGSNVVKLDLNMLEFRNKVFMSMGSVFLVVKKINYTPTVVAGTVNYASSDYTNILCAKLGVSVLPSKFEVTFTSGYSFPIYVGYNYINKSVVYTPNFRTFHTLSTYSVCTGSYGSSFWTDDTVELTRRLSAINLDSLGSTKLKGKTVDNSDIDIIYLTDFLSNATDFNLITDGWNNSVSISDSNNENNDEENNDE